MTDVREIVVTWGRERMVVAPGCEVEVGPFAMSVCVREGESVRDAFDATMQVLDEVARADFERKVKAALARSAQLTGDTGMTGG